MTSIKRCSDPAIKRISALQSRQERERTGLFFVEGLRIVITALQLGAAIDTLIIAPDMLKSREVYSLIMQQHRAGVPCMMVSADVFRHLSRRDGPQGLAAIVWQRWEPLARIGRRMRFGLHSNPSMNRATLVRSSERVMRRGRRASFCWTPFSIPMMLAPREPVWGRSSHSVSSGPACWTSHIGSVGKGSALSVYREMLRPPIALYVTLELLCCAWVINTVTNR